MMNDKSRPQLPNPITEEMQSAAEFQIGCAESKRFGKSRAAIKNLARVNRGPVSQGPAIIRVWRRNGESARVKLARAFRRGCFGYLVRQILAHDPHRSRIAANCSQTFRNVPGRKFAVAVHGTDVRPATGYGHVIAICVKTAARTRNVVALIRGSDPFDLC